MAETNYLNSQSRSLSSNVDIIEQSTKNVIRNREVSKGYLFIKRLIDITGALFGLIICLPLFIIVGLFFMFGENKGPVFFKQERFGLNGTLFRIYKFRSMVVEADKKLKSNPKLYAKYIKNNYKLEPHEDPRITKFGHFLRQTSIDEIPQLINVLKGEMSLVGPRPIVKEELKEYKDKKDIFLSVKPGITGYWQSNGRSNIGYPERVNIELYYIYNRSLWLDLKIIVKTLGSIITKKGAY